MCDGGIAGIAKAAAEIKAWVMSASFPAGFDAGTARFRLRPNKVDIVVIKCLLILREKAIYAAASSEKYSVDDLNFESLRSPENWRARLFPKCFGNNLQCEKNPADGIHPAFYAAKR